MSSIEGTNVASTTSAARLEPNISTEHIFTDIIHLKCVALTGTGTMNDFLATYLKGCGRVDLVSLQAKFCATEEAACVKIGMAEAGSSESIDTLCLKENGVIFVSNPRTTGVSELVTLVPEDYLSRQIKPVSSMLPVVQLQYSITKNITMALIFKVKVHGMRMRYGSLN